MFQSRECQAESLPTYWVTVNDCLFVCFPISPIVQAVGNYIAIIRTNLMISSMSQFVCWLDRWTGMPVLRKTLGELPAMFTSAATT